MNFPDNAPVLRGKLETLRARIARLQIDLRAVEEQFVRGGGKGGQKINKTSNAVLLAYAPLSLIVRVQRERQREVNRFLALRELADRIEMTVSPQTSERLKERKRRRKQKKRRKRRTKQSFESLMLEN